MAITDAEKQSSLNDTLREVIQNLIDGQEGFQTIGEQLKDESLKRYFLAESLKRARFRADLENELHHAGFHDVKESGTVAGKLHRVWGDLKAKLGGGDHSLLATAEQGEDEAKKVYAEAIKETLPLPVHKILSEQYAHIQTSHDFVRNARDQRKAA
ncbi:PA2169 family four-helix-bundle protein [Terriglobus tenax]|uniref:PA2169 family four-helix-bundle protein n=1 Tax=Terriglobus tenax TaxID=1111115 RepID=UPI0021DFABA8|nr:PA2169 family four-helix-bundle protein [Terriglobus tenax]